MLCYAEHALHFPIFLFITQPSKARFIGVGEQDKPPTILALILNSLVWAVFVLAVWALTRRVFGRKASSAKFQADQPSAAGGAD